LAGIGGGKGDAVETGFLDTGIRQRLAREPGILEMKMEKVT
jgi:hypothetical protein